MSFSTVLCEQIDILNATRWRNGVVITTDKAAAPDGLHDLLVQAVEQCLHPALLPSLRHAVRHVAEAIEVEGRLMKHLEVGVMAEEGRAWRRMFSPSHARGWLARLAQTSRKHFTRMVSLPRAGAGRAFFMN